MNRPQLCTSVYSKLTSLPGKQLSLRLRSTPPVPAAADGFILKLSPCKLTLPSVTKRLRDLSARPTVMASSREFKQV